MSGLFKPGVYGFDVLTVWRCWLCEEKTHPWRGASPPLTWAWIAWDDGDGLVAAPACPSCVLYIGVQTRRPVAAAVLSNEPMIRHDEVLDTVRWADAQ